MAKFDYFNDPSSDTGPPSLPPPFSIEGDTITYSGWPVTNFSSEPKSEIDLYTPFLWVRLGPTDDPVNGEPYDLIPLTWNNGKDGWYTKDFADTGTSLLVTLQVTSADAHDALDGEVAVGKVAADSKLDEVFTLQGTPSPDHKSEDLEVLHRGDKVPFVNLGSFGAVGSGEETKTYDLAFTFDWGGDHPDDALRVNGATYTIVPADQHAHDHHAHDHSADYLIV